MQAYYFTAKFVKVKYEIWLKTCSSYNILLLFCLSVILAGPKMKEVNILYVTERNLGNNAHVVETVTLPQKATTVLILMQNALNLRQPNSPYVSLHFSPSFSLSLAVGRDTVDAPVQARRWVSFWLTGRTIELDDNNRLGIALTSDPAQSAVTLGGLYANVLARDTQRFIHFHWPERREREKEREAEQLLFVLE